MVINKILTNFLDKLPSNKKYKDLKMIEAIELNEVRNENCLDTMKLMNDNFIDLTVTSPPYDDLRAYNGYSFDFESIAKELYRVTKQGGVVVWVVGDATKKGSESLTSFRQALFFKESGFNVETMIFETSTYMPIRANRYDNNFQYMFVFSKGKPKTFNPIMVKKSEKSLQRGKSGRDVSFRELDGKRQDKKPQKITTHKKKTNIWRFLTGFCSSSDNIASKHPEKYQFNGDMIDDVRMSEECAIESALICVNRILDAVTTIADKKFDFYTEVKIEINKL